MNARFLALQNLTTAVSPHQSRLAARLSCTRALRQRKGIDNLDGVTIRNPTIIGGSISGTSGIGGGSVPSPATFGQSFEIQGGYLAPTTTLTVLFPAGFIASASSSVTDIYISGTASTSALIVSALNAANCDVKASTAGVLSCGTDATGAGGASFGQAWEIFGSGASAYLAPTSTIRSIIAAASSTIGSGTQAGGLTIFGGATTTGNAYFAGNVGIGTVAPGGKLTVSGNWVSGNKALQVTDAAGDEMLSFYANEGANPDTLFIRGWIGATIRTGDNQSLTIDTPSVADQIFKTNFSERMRITSGGNIGIGTTSPYAKLSVVGPVVAEYFHATSSAATSTFTNFVATGNASTTNLIVSGLNAANCDVKASPAGVLSCGTDASGSGQESVPLKRHLDHTHVLRRPSFTRFHHHRLRHTGRRPHYLWRCDDDGQCVLCGECGDWDDESVGPALGLYFFRRQTSARSPARQYGSSSDLPRRQRCRYLDDEFRPPVVR